MPINPNIKEQKSVVSSVNHLLGRPCGYTRYLSASDYSNSDKGADTLPQRLRCFGKGDVRRISSPIEGKLEVDGTSGVTFLLINCADCGYFR